MRGPTEVDADHAPPPRLQVRVWWSFFRRAGRIRRYGWPMLGTALLVAACDAAVAHITRWVVDGVVRAGSAAPFGLYIGVYLFVMLLLCVGVWSFQQLAGRLTQHISHDIRQEAFGRLMELEFAFFDTHPAGWCISRLTRDCHAVGHVIAFGLIEAIWSLSYIAFIAGSLLYMHWQLGLLVLIVLPPLVLTSIVIQRKLLRAAREIGAINSRIVARCNESIQSAATTRTLGREEGELAEFRQLSSGLFRATVESVRLGSIYSPLVMAFASLGTGLALWQGGWLALNGALTLGTLVAFVHFSGQLFGPINRLACVLADARGAQAAAERVLELLSTEPGIRDQPALVARLVAAGPERAPGMAPDGFNRKITRLEFQEVDFKYATGPMVLRGFNLKVQAGEMVALVGPSGAGKSTIVSLAARFYEPTGGRITVDGIDYRDRSLRWYQEQLGVVLQSPHLFPGTIRENIRYGRRESTDTDVEHAARLLGAHDAILRLEQGYDTEVGEGGGRLSAGQRQLVSLARALLADPQILIMDEATSSIDPASEQLIQQGLQAIFRGRISFVIAHRLGTVRRATRLLVIVNGQIVESGSHRELLALRGHYFRLYAQQYAAEREQQVLRGNVAPA